VNGIVLTQSSVPPAKLASTEDLLAIFRGAEKPRAQFRVGAEAEKFGVDAKTGAPISYGGDKGISRILQDLVVRHGWRGESEYEGGPTLALVKDRQANGLPNANVTLEPGSQLELSGAPMVDVHAIHEEMAEHLAQIAPISAELGLVWLGLGFHPLARQEDLDWVPKLRYGIMREYLPTRGKYGLDMMRRTSTVQANFDYSSEADALRKLRVSSKLAPVTTAVFANSPFVEGALTGEVSRRARVWLDVDPDRTGLLPFCFAPDAGFGGYVDWALDCPMFLFKRDGKPVDNRGQTFRDFLAHGFGGHRATASDWEMHLNTLFPEVRLKRTIEIRGADSLPLRYFAALPALWTGILYDDQALAEAEALVADYQVAELDEVRQRVPADGLRTPFRGRPLAAVAERVVDIARGGLVRRAIKDAAGKDESVHLDAISRLVARAECPAAELRARVAGASDLRAAILEHARV